MGGRDGQNAGGVIGEEVGEPADVARLVKNALGNHQQRFARLGHAQ